MKTKIIFILLFIFVIAILTGCTQSQHWITVQFVNPHNNRTETIDVPVTQYEYESHNVGQGYSVKVHTTLGIQIAVNDGVPTKVQMADVLPVAVFAVGIVFVTMSWDRKRNIIKNIIPILIVLILSIGLLATMQPEFTANGTIINKDFVISSGGF